VVPTLPSPDHFTDQALENLADHHAVPESALEAVLEAHRLLGLSLGTEIAKRRNRCDSLQNAVANAKLLESLLNAYREVAEILIEHVRRSIGAIVPTTRPSTGSASCA
jgi:hypothetical protein